MLFPLKIRKGLVFFLFFDIMKRSKSQGSYEPCAPLATARSMFIMEDLSGASKDIVKNNEERNQLL